MDFIRLVISSPKLLIAGTILTIAVVAVPITMTLVNQQQDIRQRAADDPVSIGKICNNLSSIPCSSGSCKQAYCGSQCGTQNVCCGLAKNSAGQDVQTYWCPNVAYHDNNKGVLSTSGSCINPEDPDPEKRTCDCTLCQRQPTPNPTGPAPTSSDPVPTNICGECGMIKPSTEPKHNICIENTDYTCADGTTCTWNSSANTWYCAYSSPVTPTPTPSSTCGECGKENGMWFWSSCSENTAYVCPGGGTCSLVSERYVCVGGTTSTPTPTPTPPYNYNNPSITPPTGYPTTTQSFDFNNGLDHCRPRTQSCETALSEYDTGSDCSAYLGVPARICRTDGYLAGVSTVGGCPTLTTDRFVQYCLPLTKYPPTGWTAIFSDVNACTNYNGLSSLCYKSTYQVTLTTPTATFTPVPPTATNVPGVPTSTFTPVPPTSTIAQGLNCDPVKDGVIDLLDFNLWRDEAFFGTEGKKTDCFKPDEKVDLLDFQVWKDIAILKIKQPF